MGCRSPRPSTATDGCHARGRPIVCSSKGDFIFRAIAARVRGLDGERPQRREAQWRVTPRGGEHAVIGTLVNCGLGDRCSERVFMGDTSARRCLRVPTAATATGRIDHGAQRERGPRRCSPCGATTCRPHHGRPPAVLHLVGAAPWPWRLARNSGLGKCGGVRCFRGRCAPCSYCPAWWNGGPSAPASVSGACDGHALAAPKMPRINALAPGPGETAHAACCPFTVRPGGGKLPAPSSTPPGPR